MRNNGGLYLEASALGRLRARLRSPWTRSAVDGFSLVDDRIIVRRRVPSAGRKIPSWLVRSVLTTVVIATIGFLLQPLSMSSLRGAPLPTAVERWASVAPGADGERLARGSLALTALAPDQQALRPISRQAAIALNTSVPFSTAPIPAASPFILPASGGQDRDRAVGCLAQAIYYEAGGDTLDDQRAVAQVVLNRLRHPLFPKTVCGVVFQGAQLRTGCQFTFTCDGSINRVPEAGAWARSRAIAAEALNGAVFAPVGYATHFHAPWVAPYWAPTLEKIVQVGGHLFYRWPGVAGAPRAFSARYAGGEVVAVGGSGLAGPAAPVVATAAVAPPTSPPAPILEPRRIAVASIDVEPGPSVDARAPLVVAPPLILLASGPRSTTRAYHPPIPRGGSAQPLLSRDR
jgi:hypothetical protein